MEDTLGLLIEILEESVKKNGEKPLTNKWLLNICKLAAEKQLQDGPSEGDGPDW